jgi:outer membrane protein
MRISQCYENGFLIFENAFFGAPKIVLWMVCLAFPLLSQEPVSAPGPAQKAYCADPGLCLHLPDDPQPQELSALSPAQASGTASAQPAREGASLPGGAPLSPTASPVQNPGPGSAQPGATRLTIHDAEQLALKNHPRIGVAELTALAYRQIYREARSALLPTIVSDATAVDVANPGNRITAGVLNNPIVFDRAAAGLFGNQLITDFGRTRNLAASAGLSAQAQQENAVATREQVVLAVDQAFYGALSADVLVKVAEQTVQARQVLVDQIRALESAKLRSALDLSFANVSLAQAQLLQVNAKNNRDAAYAVLSETLGLPNQQPFTLVEPEPQVPPGKDIDEIIRRALANRPDLKALELAQSADEHFATAEEKLQLPNINALGAAGITPVKDNLITSNGYGAVGVNIQVPIFNGFLLTARAQEAKLRARASAQRLRDLRDVVSRDVRVAWLDMNGAFEREAVATQLLDQATLGLNLAQARYKLGLSSIVELTQAQLQQVEAEISTVTAKYDYEYAISVLAFRTGLIAH